MVAISFERRFAEAVARGEKRQTVRRERKRPIATGDRLQLYTGMRTKNCRKLADAVCLGTESITIDEGELFVGGRFLDAHDREGFAWADGFKNFDAMVAWFRQKSGLPFEGRVIRWEIVDG